MKPLDHYRLTMYLHQRKLLQRSLDEVNSKIEIYQQRASHQIPLGRRILNWWFA